MNVKAQPVKSMEDLQKLHKTFSEMQTEFDTLMQQKKAVELVQVDFQRGAQKKLKHMMKTIKQQMKDVLALKEAIGLPVDPLSEERNKHCVEDIVSLNVGGDIYFTTRSTLCTVRNTMLEAMFSGRHTVFRDKNGHVFLDRDGTLFRYILNYLRTKKIPDVSTEKMEEILAEADYFGIDSLVKEIKARLSGRGQFAVLRYNENSNYNNLSFQGLTAPVPLLNERNNCYQCIDEVLTEMDGKGWRLVQMSGDSEGGWMYIFRKEVGTSGPNYPTHKGAKIVKKN